LPMWSTATRRWFDTPSSSSETKDDLTAILPAPPPAAHESVCNHSSGAWLFDVFALSDNEPGRLFGVKIFPFRTCRNRRARRTVIWVR
jgi:hypothetical protein